MVQGSKFENFGKIVDLVRKPFIVVGLLGSLIIYYFQYKNFFIIFTWKHILACSVLTAASSLAAVLTAHLSRLSRAQIISIGIDTAIQNTTFSYSMLKVNRIISHLACFLICFPHEL